MSRPVVVKLGSALVVDRRGRVRRELLRARAAEIGELVGAGTPVCVVSSGAIALGLHSLGLTSRPRSLPRLQAASALGQSRLQRAWEEAFARHGLRAAQVLLTGSEIADRRAYVNVRGALGALFDVGAVPVVNENDATATDEISFGDNDALAAQVAVLCGARLLVLLTSVDGVYTQAPGAADATLISEGADARAAAFGAGSAFGRGGMESKVQAAELAAAAGIATVIASGTGDAVLGPLVAGEARGTRFRAQAGSGSAYKLWLRFGKRIDARSRRRRRQARDRRGRERAGSRSGRAGRPIQGGRRRRAARRGRCPLRARDRLGRCPGARRTPGERRGRPSRPPRPALTAAGRCPHLLSASQCCHRCRPRRAVRGMWLKRRCQMTTVPHEPSRIADNASWSTRLLVPEMWASLTIIVMWLSVLVDAAFGPDIVTRGVAGDTATVPSAVVVALFAFLGTWVVAKYGFRHGRTE